MVNELLDSVYSLHVPSEAIRPSSPKTEDKSLAISNVSENVSGYLLTTGFNRTSVLEEVQNYLRPMVHVISSTSGSGPRPIQESSYLEAASVSFNTILFARRSGNLFAISFLFGAISGYRGQNQNLYPEILWSLAVPREYSVLFQWQFRNYNILKYKDFDGSQIDWNRIKLWFNFEKIAVDPVLKEHFFGTVVNQCSKLGIIATKKTSEEMKGLTYHDADLEFIDSGAKTIKKVNEYGKKQIIRAVNNVKKDYGLPVGDIISTNFVKPVESTERANTVGWNNFVTETVTRAFTIPGRT